MFRMETIFDMIFGRNLDMEKTERLVFLLNLQGLQRSSCQAWIC